MADIINEQTVDEIINIDISDELLEALACAGHAGAYTQFGICTVSLTCPGSGQERRRRDRHAYLPRNEDKSLAPRALLKADRQFDR